MYPAGRRQVSGSGLYASRDSCADPGAHSQHTITALSWTTTVSRQLSVGSWWGHVPIERLREIKDVHFHMALKRLTKLDCFKT